MARPMLSRLGVIVVLACGPLAASAEPQPRPLPVVRTWADLLDTQPIEYHGHNFRLGVEADHCAVYGGVLVYCLADGPLPKQHVRTSEVLGPLGVKLRWPGVTEQTQMMQTMEPKVEGVRLYVRPLGIGQRGEPEIQILGDDDQVIAACQLKISDEPYHAWLPLRHPYRDPKADPKADARGQPAQANAERDAVIVTLVNAVDQVALPHWEGTRPIVFDGTARGKRIRRERGEPLPRLLPEQPDPNLRLSRDGDIFTVESNTDLAPASSYEHFLVRWWVNDKPFIPEERVPMQRMSQAMQQMQRPQKPLLTVRMRLAFDPSKLGAEKGDRIGMQMLHCPERFEALRPPGFLQQQTFAPDLGASDISRMTNRIEFNVE
jgi:hypothetical protein